MEKHKPGILRALAYIEELREQSDRKEYLPGIRKLASRAGVSYVTMWKALKRLKERKVVVAGEGSGKTLFFSGKAENEKLVEKPVEKSYRDKPAGGSWGYVADQLYKEIVSGRYRGGEKLPSCKELQQRYGASFATLKKALIHLIDEHIVEPRSSGYYVPSLTGNTGHARIVAIGCGWEDGKIWVDYQDKNYFRVLESECIRMNIRLDVVVHFQHRGRLRFLHTASKKEYDLSDRTILGFIFIVANLESTPEEVLERLVRIRRNVAVLDVVGGWNVPRCAQGNRQVQIFTATASVLPAKRVAQYLLGRNHRQIAFFSPFHKALWSQRRFETIEEMFTRAGYPDGVRPMVYDEYAYQWDYLKNPDHEEDLRLLVDQYREWKREAHGEIFKRFGNLGYSIVKYITEWNCASGEIYEKMKPLFEEALAEKGITAWVMANDFAATIAMDFLKEREIHIPEDLSIISFDNTLDAMEYQLTSFDFNNHGIITMMLRHILAPHTITGARRSSRGCIEVDGTLVIRRSTAVIPELKTVTHGTA